MKKTTYKIIRFLKLPLLCCSGCMIENCEHRINNFRAPCISWRKYSDHPNGFMLEAFLKKWWVSLMQTITKTAKEIQPGDIFRSEYGDYGNWSEFVFISCEPDKDFKNCTKINVRNINNNTIFSIYDLNPIDKVKFDVIGKTEVPIYESTNNS